MRYIFAGALFAVAAFFGTCTGSHAQISCQRIGNQTYCSDGSSANQIGNFTYIQPAPVYIQPAPPPTYYQPAPLQPLPTPFQRYR